MAIDFVHEIYVRAKVIYGMKLCCEHLIKRSKDNFVLVWNENSDGLLAAVTDLAKYDEKASNKLSLLIDGVISKDNDVIVMNELIDGGIIPLLYQQLSYYGGIDVTEENYKLKSSRSGYITLYDIKNSVYIHSLDDPMWEALIMAKALYKGKHTVIKILGAGLGYLARAFWMVSSGSIEIYIYENNQKIVDYAHLYGVIDEIPKNKVHYIVEENTEDLFVEMMKPCADVENVLIYASDWMKYCFEGELRNNIEMMCLCNWAYIGFENDYNTNYWKNKKQFIDSFYNLKNTINKNEFIVVAAGPSFDNCISYLKENKGKKTIIAVNTILKRMLENDIVPDFVCLMDPTDGVFAHLDGIVEKTENIPLISESVAYWKYVHEYRGPKYCAYASIYPDAIDEAERRGIECIGVGSTVTSFAIEIAVRLGAVSIDLVGVDLSFPGDIYHAGDKQKRKTTSTIQDINVKSVDGGMVKSVDTFEIFRRDIEKQIYSYPQVVFTNLSEHGALIAGTVSGIWREAPLSIYKDRLSILREQDLCCLIRIWGILSDVEFNYWNYVGKVSNISFSSDLSDDEADLVSEILMMWMEKADVENQNRAVIYLSTVLLSISKKENILKCAIERLDKNASDDYSVQYFINSQLRSKIESNDITCYQFMLEYIDKYEPIIVERICSELEESALRPINKERNSSLTLIIIDSIDESYLENAENVIPLNHASSIVKNGKQVVIINTSEKYPIIGRVPIYKEHVRENCADYVKNSKIEINGEEIPYFQCEEFMPDIDGIKIIIDFVRKYLPNEIYSYSKESPMVRILNKIVDIRYIE